MWRRTQLLPQLERRKQRKTKQKIPHTSTTTSTATSMPMFCSVLYVCMYVRRYICVVWVLGIKIRAPQCSAACSTKRKLCIFNARECEENDSERERERESALEHTHTYNAMLEKLPLVYSCLKQLMHIKVSSDSAASSDVDSRQRKSALFAKLARQRAPACLKWASCNWINTYSIV